MNKKLLFIIFSICQIGFCQTKGEQLLHGKIKADSGNLDGVTIVNLVNEKGCTSDGNGAFTILAKAGDLLVFSSKNFEYHRRIIEEEDFKSPILYIQLTPKTIELEEVVINKHPEINAVSLGISPKGIVQFTPAERKLYTANSTPIDALLNLMSGRTAMLKKELEVEKKERLLTLLDPLFEEKYYTNTLKIPKEYIKGFQYYCLEDQAFATSLHSKNKTMTNFLIVTLAKNYNKIIQDES